MALERRAADSAAGRPIFDPLSTKRIEPVSPLKASAQSPHTLDLGSLDAVDTRSNEQPEPCDIGSPPSPGY